jgi:aminoglycoside phosphotransferase (APT) family kinase protein
MAYLTKNTQSKSKLMKLIQCAFPQKKLENLQELTEGYFNMAYEASFQDGFKSILKIAPSPNVEVMTYEQDIMKTEVHTMQLIAQKTKVPVPKIQFYDSSCTLCNAPYFFMEKIEGKSFSSQKSFMSYNQISHINFLVGEFNREINKITNDYFGYPGQKVLQGRDWYGVFVAMVKAVILDADRKNIDLTICSRELLRLLEEDKVIFRSVLTPQLVHWDIWDGNVFIENDKVMGIIDWERSLWGDPLMEVGFRSYAQSPDFLRGYGLYNLTQAEKRRILWYDIYLLMTVAQEHVYRGYETTESYEWATTLLRKKYRELKNSF